MMAQDGRKYSDYYHELESSMKARYLEKLDSIGQNVSDPYSFESGTGTTDMPEIEYPDIYNFLVNTPSPD